MLEEFGANTSSWSGDQFSYVVAMLRQISDETLCQLAAHENIETGGDSVIDAPSFWEDGKLRVFISHLSAHKVFASEVQGALSSFGICAFVAHEDIEPTADWQDEIEKALRTCDALVALLHSEFDRSTWTDQEVGYGIGRGVPVFSVRLGMSPYGLFGRKQAFNGNGKEASEIAKELFEAYLVHPKTHDKMADVVVGQFTESASFADAKSRMALVEQLNIWKPEYKKLLRDAVEKNSQVRHSWGVPERVEALLAKRAPDADDDIPF
ncbi:TIR domain-containing protein [Rhodobacter sp. JA431]|nr:TIR domain-containing protein [Rhodobacter sp. JA431]